MAALSSAEVFGDDFGGARMWGLRELPLSDISSILPQTVGWIYLSALLFSLMLIYGLRRHQRWKKLAPRRNAKKSLLLMRSDLARLRDLPHLIRHIALCYWSRDVVSELHGAAWISWLNKTAGSQLFMAGDAELLNRLAYAKHPDIDHQTGQQLVDATLKWVDEAHV